MVWVTGSMCKYKQMRKVIFRSKCSEEDGDRVEWDCGKPLEGFKAGE